MTKHFPPLDLPALTKPQKCHQIIAYILSWQISLALSTISANIDNAQQGKLLEP